MMRTALVTFFLFAHGVAIAATPVAPFSSIPDTGDSTACTSGTCISALGLDSTRYTGWIYMGRFNKLALYVTFTDANDSVTTVTTTCYASDVASTANGSGYEICASATSGAATTVSCPEVHSITTGTAESYVVIIDDIAAEYVNCAFAATGSAAAADTVTVKASRRSL